MPLNLSQELINPLIQRELAKEQMQERFAPRAEDSAPPPVKPLSPGLVSALGAGVDAASTYRFMKNGTGREDNAMFSHGSPAATAALGAATGPLGYLLLKRINPKLADMWGSQVGGHQLGIGALNLSESNPQPGPDKFIMNSDERPSSTRFNDRFNRD
jgi:hypothetical protein